MFWLPGGTVIAILSLLLIVWLLLNATLQEAKAAAIAAAVGLAIYFAYWLVTRAARGGHGGPPLQL
jgi:apolipoprotein N-acyltransferase